MVGISWVISIYPFCKRCLSRIKENPDVVKSEYSIGPTKNSLEVTSITTTATIPTHSYEDLTKFFNQKI